jgi:NTE family protein
LAWRPKLRQFWELVTSPIPQWQFPRIPTVRSASSDDAGDFAALSPQLELLGYENDLPSLIKGDAVRTLLNQWSASRALSLGAPGFFAPRPLTPWLWPHGSIEATSYQATASFTGTAA